MFRGHTVCITKCRIILCSQVLASVCVYRIYQLGHPKRFLFLLLNDNIYRIKVSQKSLFDFERKITGSWMRELTNCTILEFTVLWGFQWYCFSWSIGQVIWKIIYFHLGTIRLYDQSIPEMFHFEHKITGGDWLQSCLLLTNSSCVASFQAVLHHFVCVLHHSSYVASFCLRNDIIHILSRVQVVARLGQELPVLINGDDWECVAEEIDDIFIGDAEVWCVARSCSD